MDEKAERRLRRKALRWLYLGQKPGAVAKRVGRSRTWLAKWRARFAEHGPAGLYSQARQPHTRPHAWASGNLWRGANGWAKPPGLVWRS
jgi:transposase